MPSIGDLQFGYDTNGVSDYLDAIHSEALQQAKDAVLNTSAIETCCNNEWEGRAKENFLNNLRTDAQHVADQFEALYGVLVSEVNSLNAAMANKDESLIS